MFSFAHKTKGMQVAFIPSVKSLCESEILEGEDGASLRRAATHVAAQL